MYPFQNFGFYVIRYRFHLCLKGAKVIQREIAVEIMYTSLVLSLYNLNELNIQLIE